MGMFQDNLRLLRVQSPQLASMLQDAGDGPFTTEMAKNGMPTARAQKQWIHSAYNPWKEAQAWANSTVNECQSGETILVMGVGLLYHVEALMQEVPVNTCVLVLIPDIGELRTVLTVRSLAGWGEHIHWLWGNVEDVATHVNQTYARLRILKHEASAVLHEQYIREFQQVLRDHVSHQIGGKLHVAVIGPIYGGSLSVARHVVAALEYLGHRVTWIDHSIHHPGFKTLDNLRDTQLRMNMQSRFGETLGVVSLAHIADDPPDLVLAMAQAPLTMPVLEQLRKKNVVTAMWFVENFRHLTYWQQVASGYDFWFVMQQDACIDALTRAGAAHVNYLPLAANPDIHRPVTCNEEEQREFVSDVSFLGAGYPNRRLLLLNLLNRGWSFKLWGNEWDNCGSLGIALQRNGARIDSETSVKIFNQTKVNINIHSYTGEGFDPDGDGINPRTFELAACGAFQVIDRRALLSQHFDDTMLATLQRPKDLVPTVQRYIHDSDARLAMAESSRQHVLAHHTYVHRMETLLATVGLHRPDRVGEVLRGGRSTEALVAKGEQTPELIPIVRSLPSSDRVELHDVATNIRSKGPTTVLSRDELLILMMDEYRQETRDFI
ncbi:MAG: glycosyltransferase family protein [Nitrospirales bacterium]